MKQTLKVLSFLLLAMLAAAAVFIVLSKYMDIFAKHYHMVKKSFCGPFREDQEPVPAEDCYYEDDYEND